MKITYLDHSGFAVTLPDAILVFDLIRDPSHALHHILNANKELPVVFFVTHNHPDHHNPDIYEMAQDHKRTYVISNDVKAMNIPSTLDVAGMSPGDVIDNVPGCQSVKAYGSTDAGVSYLVTTTDGRTIFHGGDLNLWHWKDESTKAEVQKAENDFKKILNRISSEVKTIDVAMFDVDPRLGTDFSQGATMFTEAVEVKNFIPMHFAASNHQEVCLFSAYIKSPQTHCICLSSPGQHVNI